ncbi:uncharacterized protein LOC118262045 [Spodoptera frugiperda]|uniref:Uncharacterized protein LOC118262045 n=1 Tax=Spodoptera frugiperda TaxID=7108 RepID=A0A9R0CTM6_SPOFR|nr:uncharacterized protein LOC118262045 [Spodoptera frugiperda]
MDFRVKFLMLWILCVSIELTASMPSQTVNTRTKRSPANSFSVFGLNLGSAFSATKQAASDTYTGFENIFTGNNYNNRKQIIEPPGIINPNHLFNMLPAGRPNKNIVPPTTQNSIPEVNKIVLPQQSQTQVNRNTNIVTEKSPTPNDQPNTTTEPPVDVKNEVKEKSTETKNIEKEIDKELLDYIFKTEPTDYNTATDSNLDNSIDYTTSTDEFETTTICTLDNRIQPAVVATLLG